MIEAVVSYKGVPCTKVPFFDGGRLEDWDASDGDVWYMFDFDEGNGDRDEVLAWAGEIADEQGILVTVDFVSDEQQREEEFVGSGSVEAYIKQKAQCALSEMVQLKKLLKKYDGYEPDYDFSAIDKACEDIVHNLL